MNLELKNLFTKTTGLKDACTHYCPGCGHGIAHRILGEVLEELGIRERTLGIAPVGCAVFAYRYINVDMVEVAHGRAPAVATGMKRVHPEKIVFSYQGDGDLASIGAAEIVHAAHRGEQITVIFINNAVYGMTCGQMAPTSLLGQVTSTTPNGRNCRTDGHPLQISEMLAVLPGTSYIERCSLHDPVHIRQAKKALRQAFEMQIAGQPGLTLIEMLSPCPTYWRMTPAQAVEWIKTDMIPVYPLGKIK